MATSKLHVIRQVLANLCKGPGFDTVWSKVLVWVHLITLVKMCLSVIFFQVPYPLSSSPSSFCASKQLLRHECQQKTAAVPSLIRLHRLTLTLTLTLRAWSDYNTVLVRSFVTAKTPALRCLGRFVSFQVQSCLKCAYDALGAQCLQIAFMLLTFNIRKTIIWPLYSCLSMADWEQFKEGMSSKAWVKHCILYHMWLTSDERHWSRRWSVYMRAEGRWRTSEPRWNVTWRHDRHSGWHRLHSCADV